jgi:hypothetical protein
MPIPQGTSTGFWVTIGVLGAFFLFAFLLGVFK